MSIHQISARLTRAGVQHVVVSASGSSDSELESYINVIDGMVTITKPADSSKVLRAVMEINPEYRAKDYLRLSVDAKRLAKTLSVEHSTLFETAFKKTHGRDPEFGDFRISGIGDDKLPAEVKDRLRGLVRRISALNTLAKTTFQKLSRMRSLKQ